MSCLLDVILVGKLIMIRISWSCDDPYSNLHFFSAIFTSLLVQSLVDKYIMYKENYKWSEYLLFDLFFS